MKTKILYWEKAPSNPDWKDLQQHAHLNKLPYIRIIAVLSDTPMTKDEAEAAVGIKFMRKMGV
jgi:hypothetical protein